MNWKTLIYTLLFVTAIGMVVTLIVFWNIFIISDYQTIKQLQSVVYGSTHLASEGRWTILVLGIAFLSMILVVLSIFFANTLRNNRFKQQQKDFVNMVTHELRLPMSSIQMFAQTMARPDIPASDRERFLEFILVECARMNLLVDHLLKSQQIETGRLPVHLEIVSAGDFIRDFKSKWLRPLNVRIECEANFNIDTMLIELALTNLVSNAEKYGRGVAPVIELTVKEGKVLITVRDGADPIPQKLSKKIFQRFYRMQNRETRQQVGVGLGLYIVRNIMRMHKGSVHVIPGETGISGNAFTLTLPRSP